MISCKYCRSPINVDKLSSSRLLLALRKINRQKCTVQFLVRSAGADLRLPPILPAPFIFPNVSLSQPDQMSFCCYLVLQRGSECLYLSGWVFLLFKLKVYSFLCKVPKCNFSKCLCSYRTIVHMCHKLN